MPAGVGGFSPGFRRRETRPLPELKNGPAHFRSYLSDLGRQRSRARARVGGLILKRAKGLGRNEIEKKCRGRQKKGWTRWLMHGMTFSSRQRVPRDFQAVIEIPVGIERKYELDKATGLLRVIRIIHSGPSIRRTNGVHSRKTYAEDNEPLDVLVALPGPCKRWRYPARAMAG